MIFKRSLIAELANLAGAVFTVLFTIVLAVAMVRFLNMAAGGSIEHGTVVQLVLYNALVNLPPLLAASLFIATLMTLMRSWQDNEMVVWFSSGGRSILSWIEPTVKFALPIVVVIALLSIVISPWARSETDRLRNSVSAREDVNAIAPGRFIEAMGGKRVFFVESAEEAGNQVRNVFMAEGDWGKESVVTAEKGTIEVNAEGDRYVVLGNGRRYEAQTDSGKTRIVEFGSYGVRLDIRIDRAFASTKTSSMPIALLIASPTPDHQAELLWRFSWPAAALLLALLAIPLSCTSPRAGRSLNLLMAALVFILYLNALSIVETKIEQQALTFWSGYAVLNGSLLILTVVLFIRRTWMTRWLPSWCSAWRLREMLAHRTKGGEA